ncbi:MAG TPA: PEGA domain-containing protein, partial [Kofleriaceae bacterium]|nr:PEGA domain-containing protein [Kofleriaceae bacterium]
STIGLAVAARPKRDDEPAIKLARLTFAVVPAGVTAKITLDGKPVTGEMEFDISAGAKEMELVVKAAGFRDYKKKISVDGDENISVELTRRPQGGSTGGHTTSGGGKKKNDKIDI